MSLWTRSSTLVDIHCLTRNTHAKICGIRLCCINLTLTNASVKINTSNTRTRNEMGRWWVVSQHAPPTLDSDHSQRGSHGLPFSWSNSTIKSRRLFDFVSDSVNPQICCCRWVCLCLGFPPKNGWCPFGFPLDQPKVGSRKNNDTRQTSAFVHVLRRSQF